MKGRIYLTEKVENRDRKFGASLEYYPIYVIDYNGNIQGALFTKNEIESAIERAKRNTEDVPTFDTWIKFLDMKI